MAYRYQSKSLRLRVTVAIKILPQSIYKGVDFVKFINTIAGMVEILDRASKLAPIIVYPIIMTQFHTIP